MHDEAVKDSYSVCQRSVNQNTTNTLSTIADRTLWTIEKTNTLDSFSAVGFTMRISNELSVFSESGSLSFLFKVDTRNSCIERLPLQLGDLELSFGWAT